MSIEYRYLYGKFLCLCRLCLKCLLFSFRIIFGPPKSHHVECRLDVNIFQSHGLMLHNHRVVKQAKVLHILQLMRASLVKATTPRNVTQFSYWYSEHIIKTEWQKQRPSVVVFARISRADKDQNKAPFKSKFTNSFTKDFPPVILRHSASNMVKIIII